MELIKKNVHMIALKGKAVSQITLEDDVNVPDSKQDIVTIIQQKNEVLVSEVKASDNHAVVRGRFKFQVLYISDFEDNKIQSLVGEIPFDETINIEGAKEGDSIKIKWETEDFNVSMINSRKISIRSILTFNLSVENLSDIETTVEVLDEGNTRYLSDGLDIVELGVNKKDIFRIKDEISINSNKPNIFEIIWSDTQLKNVDIKALEGTMSIKGELDVFVLYKGEDEEQSIQWIENTLNFSGNIDCSGCTEDMIADVEITIEHQDIEAKPDYDGEQRLVNVDMALTLDIRLLEEAHIDIVTDAYCPSKSLIPITKEAVFDTLVVKNFSKCRVSDRVKISSDSGKNKEGQYRILQICHSSGVVKIDEIIPIEDGISVEGIIEVSILYITSDDSMPFNVVKGVVPFNHIIEAKGIDDTSVYNLRADLEQMSCIMIDSEEIEVKAVVNLNAIVLNKEKRDIIESIEIEPLDYAKLEELPGIVGYIVKNDDTLWKLAKRYYTTVEKIKETNELTGDNIKLGDKLIIVKDIS